MSHRGGRGGTEHINPALRVGLTPPGVCCSTASPCLPRTNAVYVANRATLNHLNFQCVPPGALPRPSAPKYARLTACPGARKQISWCLRRWTSNVGAPCFAPRPPWCRWRGAFRKMCADPSITGPSAFPWNDLSGSHGVLRQTYGRGHWTTPSGSGVTTVLAALGRGAPGLDDPAQGMSGLRYFGGEGGRPLGEGSGRLRLPCGDTHGAWRGLSTSRYLASAVALWEKLSSRARDVSGVKLGATAAVSPVPVPGHEHQRFRWHGMRTDSNPSSRLRMRMNSSPVMVSFFWVMERLVP